MLSLLRECISYDQGWRPAPEGSKWRRCPCPTCKVSKIRSFCVQRMGARRSGIRRGLVEAAAESGLKRKFVGLEHRPEGKPVSRGALH